MATVNVSDRTPKAIIRYIIIEGKDPCDVASLNDLLDEWLNGARDALLRCLLPAPGLDTGQILSQLDYQRAYVFGDRNNDTEFRVL
jgi:hypothetical protein